jgi:SNF2 family DNA or RNA helicase
MKYPWDAFVMDESHRLKAPGGKASRAAAMLAHGGGAQRSEIPFRLALTGTPMPHDPLDLYAQYRILDPSILGTSYQRLKMRYAVMTNIPGAPVPIVRGWRVQQGPYYNQALADEFDAKFHSLAYVVGPEVLNIPAPLHIIRFCELGSKGQRIYNDLEKNFYAEVEAGEITASNALVKALRLQQAASGFARLSDAEGSEIEIDDSKKALLADLLADVDEPVVVFCRFRHDLDAVHEACKSLKIGSMELSGRRNDLAEWQLGRAPILAVQTQAGGVGIDLSRAKIAIYYSLGLSLGDHLQSLSRLQAKDMTWHPAYYYLLAKGTVDEKVYRALHDRKDVIEEIMKR